MLCLLGPSRNRTLGALWKHLISGVDNPRSKLYDLNERPFGLLLEAGGGDTGREPLSS